MEVGGKGVRVVEEVDGKGARVVGAVDGGFSDSDSLSTLITATTFGFLVAGRPSSVAGVASAAALRFLRGIFDGGSDKGLKPCLFEHSSVPRQHMLDSGLNKFDQSLQLNAVFHEDDCPALDMEQVGLKC